MTNTGYGGCHQDGDPERRTSRDPSERITVNTPQAGKGAAEDRRTPGQDECRRALDRRLPLQRSPLALAEAPGMRAGAKYRINPGNVGHGKKRDEQFAQMIEIACRYDKPVRIGVTTSSVSTRTLARIMDERVGAQRGRDRDHARGDGQFGARVGGQGRGAWTAPATASSLSCKVSGVQDLDRHLPRLVTPLRLSAAPRAGPRPAWGRRVLSSTAAMAVLCNRASATPSAFR